MVEVLLFVLGLVGTVALGAPVIGRLASPDAWRDWARNGPSNGTAPVKTHVIAAFSPLDLGPDPSHWPSERPWPASRLAQPDWPSKSWDDDHFGTHWRKSGSAQDQAVQAAHAARAAQAAAAPARPQRPTADAEAAFFGDAAAPEPRPAKPAKPAKPAPAKAAPARPAPAKAAPARPAPAKAAPAKPAPAKAPPAKPAAPAAGAPPSRAEIQALVEAYGLAGAVKQIMERTGWDFRTAAQYLAQHR